MSDDGRKASRTHPARTLVCEKCSRSFVAYHKKSLCPECYAQARREYMRDYARKRAGKVQAKAAERSVAEPKAEPRAEGSAADAKRTFGRCLFCGSILKKEGRFCKTCLREGFNNVYEATGRSNGWDRKPGMRVKVVSGWRGQSVIGGNRSSSGLEPRGW